MKGLAVVFLALFVALLSQANASSFVNFGVRASSAPIGSINLPTVGLTALYSVLQQRGYAGPCLRVQRTSDNAQLDIQFLNGVCDVASAMTFAGAGSAFVIKWYDQTGNGYHATASVGNAPKFSSVNIYGSIPGISINPDNSNQMFDLPTALTMDSRNQTEISVQMMESAGFSLGQAAVWLIGADTNKGVALSMNVLNDKIFYAGTSADTGFYSYSSQPSVTAVTASATGKTYQLNSQLKTGIGATLAATTTGGFIGNLARGGGNEYWGQQYILAIYSTVISQPTLASNISTLMTKFNIPTTYNYRIVFDGDSITRGVGAILFQNNPYQTKPLLNSSVYIRTIGVDGTNLSMMRSNEPQSITGSYDASLTKNVVLISGGTNDICNSGSNGTTLFTGTLEPYVATAKAAGYQVVVGTLIYNTLCSAGQNTERIAYNNLVRANNVTDGYVIADYDAITQLQFPQTPGYSADGTHPTTIGYSLMATTASNALNTIIP